MKMVTTKAIAKVAAVATGLAMVTSIFALAPMAQAAALTPSQVQSILSLLSSFGADSTTIANVQSSLTGSAPSMPTTPSTSSCSFTRDLTAGSTGADVTCLQNALKAGGYMSANATGYFGALTKSGVMAWQSAKGVSPAAGYFGAKSRAAFGGMTGPVNPNNPTIPVTGNGLKVMLASDSPMASAFVQGQGIAELAKYTFSNPTGSEVSVTSLAFKRIGASTDTAIDNVYLYQGAKRLTDPAGISSSAFNFNDSAGVFKVPAGGIVTVSVRADIDSAANGQQLGAQLVSVSSGATLDSSVVFPVSGAIHTVSSATIASVSWGAITPTGGTFAPATDTTVFKGTLTVNNRAVWLRSIQFENRGSTNDADFQNVKLYVKGVQVGSSMSLSGDKVVFDLTGSPVTLNTGGSEIRVVADVVGGSGETFDFQIRRGIDIMLVDSELNQPLAPSAPTAVTANTVEGVSLSVVKANTSPTSNVAVASTNVLWGKFEARAAGDDLKIEQITVDADTTLAAGMDNVRIMLNGVQVGSTQDVADGAGTTFSLGSSMILKAGQTGVIEIYGDAKTAAGTNFATTNIVDVGIAIALADTEGVSSGDSIGSAISEVEGNSITVSSASLSGTKASGYGNQTMVAGTNSAKIGSFTLSSGSTEGVNVSSIVLNLSATEAATITDLMLKDSSTGTQIGTTKSAPSTANTFSTNLSMGTSQTKTIDVFANIKSGSGVGTVIVDLDDTTGGTGATTGQSITIGSDVSLQTITIGSGSLTVTRDPGTPVNVNVIAGATMQLVGKFDFAAVSSSFTIQDIQVKIPADAATSVSNVTLKYKNQAGVEQTASQALTLSSGAQTHATATFTGLSFFAPQSGSADLDVYVDVPTIASGAKSGAAISVSLENDEAFKAIDSAGTQDTTLNAALAADIGSADTSGYGTKYVKKSLMVLSRLTTGYTANTVATGMGLYRFSVTADAAGSIDWRELSFTVTTNTSEFTNFQLYDVTGTAVQIGSTVTNLAATTLSFCPGTSCAIGEAEQIGAGATKTYEIRSTVTNWNGAGDSVTVSFAEDTSAIVNAAASALHAGQNMVWSGRSADSHTTVTTDWTNGYLVKDTDNDTRSCQYGTATTCTP